MSTPHYFLHFRAISLFLFGTSMEIPNFVGFKTSEYGKIRRLQYTLYSIYNHITRTTLLTIYAIDNHHVYLIIPVVKYSKPNL
jgi:hypothetical protein